MGADAGSERGTGRGLSALMRPWLAYQVHGLFRHHEDHRPNHLDVLSCEVFLAPAQQSVREDQSSAGVSCIYIAHLRSRFMMVSTVFALFSICQRITVFASDHKQSVRET